MRFELGVVEQIVLGHGGLELLAVDSKMDEGVVHQQGVENYQGLVFVS